MFPWNPSANISCKYPLLPNEVHWMLTLHHMWYLFCFLKVFAKKGAILLPKWNHLSQSPLKAEQDSVGGPLRHGSPSVSLISCS